MRLCYAGLTLGLHAAMPLVWISQNQKYADTMAYSETETIRKHHLQYLGTCANMPRYSRLRLMQKTAREKGLALFARSGVLRPRDFVTAGVPAWAVYELLKDGTAERIGRGLYALANGKMTENRSYLETVKRIPKGIIC